MPKVKADIYIGKRMGEEARRLFVTPTIAAKAFRCDRRLIYEWESGKVPGALWLARLYYLGGDVIYVLTGKRSVKDG